MKKPLWLKYGLIVATPLVIFGIFLFLLPLIPLFQSVDLTSLPAPLKGVFAIIAFLIYVAIRLVLLPLETLGDSLPFDLVGCCGEVPMPTMAGMVISLIIWFLIGALVGYLKSRRKDEYK